MSIQPIAQSASRHLMSESTCAVLTIELGIGFVLEVVPEVLLEFVPELLSELLPELVPWVIY